MAVRLRVPAQPDGAMSALRHMAPLAAAGKLSAFARQGETLRYTCQG
jgi:hypothetical protein